MEWDFKRWPNFTPDEMRCKGTGALLIVPEFMDRLQELRNIYGQPIHISSAYRTSQYNEKVSSTGKDGPHTTGRAVDISVYGQNAVLLIKLSIECGFTGIGIKQKGPISGRFIHLDDLKQQSGRPRPWIWSY